MISSLIFLLLLAIGVPKIVEYTIVLYRNSTSKKLVQTLEEEDVPLLKEAAPEKKEEVELGPYRKAWIPEDNEKDEWDYELEEDCINRLDSDAIIPKAKFPPGTVIKVPINKWMGYKSDILDEVEDEIAHQLNLKVKEIWDDILSNAIKGNVEIVNIKDLKEKEIEELIKIVNRIGCDVVREGHNSIKISIGHEALEARNILDIQRSKIYRSRREALNSIQR